MLPDGFNLAEFVQSVLSEDLGSGGDVTSIATIAADARFSAEMNARQSIVVAGLEIAAAFFRTLDVEVEVEFIRETFARTPSESVRILVTHHPLFAMQVGDEIERAVGRHELALDAVEESGVDMVLAGHAHHATSQDAGDLVTRAGGVLVVQAGTATSTRVREQEQSFNTIDIDDSLVTVTVHGWTGDEFKANDARAYEWVEGRWKLRKAPEPAH